VEESTALGIAGLAGVGAGTVELAAIGAANPPRATYNPLLDAAERRAQRDAWGRFVSAALAV
jgi:glycerol kinase